MSAQNTRLNTVASNIANAETVSSSIDQTYRARHPVFATTFQDAQAGTSQSLFEDQGEAGQGVQVKGIVEDQSTLEARYEPNHPAANKDGYVYYPNVNVVEEMADMISASRAFQTNAEPDEHGQEHDAESSDSRAVIGNRHDHYQLHL